MLLQGCCRTWPVLFRGLVVIQYGVRRSFPQLYLGKPDFSTVFEDYLKVEEGWEMGLKVMIISIVQWATRLPRRASRSNHEEALAFDYRVSHLPVSTARHRETQPSAASSIIR